MRTSGWNISQEAFDEIRAMVEGIEEPYSPDILEKIRLIAEKGRLPEEDPKEGEPRVVHTFTPLDEMEVGEQAAWMQWRLQHQDYELSPEEHERIKALLISSALSPEVRERLQTLYDAWPDK